MADTNETTTINLTNDITVNGRTYKAGERVVVPKASADDLARMDHEHNKYKDSLMKKRVFETNSGSIAAGGGTQ